MKDNPNKDDIEQMSGLKRDSWLIRNTKRFLIILRAPGQIRHLRRFVASHKPGYLFDKPSPWLGFDAIDYLAGRIAPGWRVFEYGSGGSTLFWLKSGAEVVSVEHDADWYAQMQQRLKQQPQVDYRLVLPESGDICEPKPDTSADPHCYHSSDPQYAGLNFRCYASQIDEFPDQYFDLVVVDGRARPSCLMHSLAKLKVGGLLVLDNTERRYYLTHVQPFLKGFAEHRFRGLGPASPVYLQTQTSIYVKQSR